MTRRRREYSALGEASSDSAVARLHASDLPSVGIVLTGSYLVSADIEDAFAEDLVTDSGIANTVRQVADEGVMDDALRAAFLKDLDEARRDLYSKIGSALRGIHKLSGLDGPQVLRLIGCPERVFDTQLALETPTQKLRRVASILAAIRDACQTLRDLGLNPTDAWETVTAEDVLNRIVKFHETVPGERSSEAIALVLQTPKVLKLGIRTRP